MPPEVDLQHIRAYLLGTLDEGQAQALETAYFADSALSDDVRAVEETLIDDYLSDTLPARDRAAFERHYLATPGHQQRVATARVLRARVAERAPAPESPDGPDPGDPAKPAPSTDRPRSLLALTLSPIVTRGDRQKSERLPEGPADLLIHLDGTPDPADRSYFVELQTVEGRIVWQGRSRPATAGSGRLASVRVPAERLEPDDYVVAIFATVGGDRVERGRYALRLVPR
jgi:anti-sigma factor RsiW